MFVSRLALRVRGTSQLSGYLRVPGRCANEAMSLGSSARHPNGMARYSSTASAGNIYPPRQWTALDPELEEALVPRKLAVSPLESWLSLRYSLPSLAGVADPQPLEESGTGSEPRALPPPVGSPELGGGEGTSPLSCKNVLEIRRRKMNRHKYKKLLKRTKFLRRKVNDGRRKHKQERFERDLKRIWKRAGLRQEPKGWVTPKIYLKRHREGSN